MSTVCRICLAVNMRLYDVNNNLLLKLYENLTDSKFNSEDARRRAVCSFCYQKLLRCYTFSQMALRSEKFLSHLCEEGLEVTQEYVTQVNLNMKQHLSMTNMQFIVIGADATNAGSKIIVKDEPLTIIDIKEEVTTEPVTLLFEDNNTNSQLTLEEDNDQGNDVEELLFNEPRTKSNVSKNSFECNSCSKIFNLKRKLISHIRNSHYQAKVVKHSFTRKQIETTSMTKVKIIQIKNKKPACHECDKTFDYKSYLIQHLRTHTGEKPFACNVCDKKFNHKFTLVRHMRTHTGEKPFACNVCNKQFKQRNHLAVHMRIHTGEKPFACNVCDKQFNQKSTLVLHMRTHTGEKPFACNVCNKQFNQRSTLVLHMRNHTGEKPFACNVCDKQFNRKHQLAEHMRTHTSEKPFACNVCDKKFNQKSSLVVHMRTHTGEKPFACNVCDKQFSVKTNLVRHMTAHTGEKSLACNVCDKKFILKHHLVDHMRIHTGEKPFACNVCDKQFNRKHYLNQHMKTHCVKSHFLVM